VVLVAASFVKNVPIVQGPLRVMFVAYGGVFSNDDCVVEFCIHSNLPLGSVEGSILNFPPTLEAQIPYIRHL